MNTLILIGAFLMGTFSSSGQSAQATNNESHLYREIHTRTLKEWYDAGKTMTVVDARSKPYYDGTLLPHAIWLPYDASVKELNAAIPKKNSLVIVYCWSAQCPASQCLVDRLIANGYTNIYKYPEGLQEWIHQVLPTNKS